MYKRVLVAVDGSDTSTLGLREAIELAKDQHSALRLIHVIDLTMAYTAVEAPYVAEYKNALQAAGEKVIADCSAAAAAAGIEFDSKSIIIGTLGQHIYDAIALGGSAALPTSHASHSPTRKREYKGPLRRKYRTSHVLRYSCEHQHAPS